MSEYLRAQLPSVSEGYHLFKNGDYACAEREFAKNTEEEFDYRMRCCNRIDVMMLDRLQCYEEWSRSAEIPKLCASYIDSFVSIQKEMLQRIAVLKRNYQRRYGAELENSPEFIKEMQESAQMASFLASGQEVPDEMEDNILGVGDEDNFDDDKAVAQNWIKGLDPLSKAAHLPPEIVTRIFDCLPYEDLIYATRVSRAWYSRVMRTSALLQRPNFKVNIGAGHMANYLKLCKKMRIKQVPEMHFSTLMSGQESDLFAKIMKSKVRVESIAVNSCCDLDFSALGLLAFRQLTALSGLTNLDLSFSPSCDSNLPPLFEHLPALETLSLSLQCNCMNKDLDGMLSIYLKGLKRLRLSIDEEKHKIHDPDELVSGFLWKCTFIDIGALVFDGLPVPQPALERLLSSAMPASVTLKNAAIKMEDFIKAVNQMPVRPSSLKLEGTVYAEAAPERRRGGLSCLRSLEIGQGVPWTDVSSVLEDTKGYLEEVVCGGDVNVVEMLKKCPRLTALKCSDVDDDKCAELGQSLPEQFARLELSCRDVTDEGIRSISGVSSLTLTNAHFSDSTLKFLNGVCGEVEGV